MRERRRVRVEGTVQGVGFRPYVYRLAAELGLAGWVLQRRARRPARDRGRDGGRGALRRAARARGAAAGDGRERLRPRRRTDRASVGSRSSRASAGARPRRSCYPTAQPATTACGSSSIRPTAATAIRSSTAPTAARASRSCARVPYDRALHDDGGVRDVRGLRGRVRRSRRPALPCPAERLPRLRAECGCRCRRRERCALRSRPSTARIRRHQGARRLSPRLPGRRRARRREAARAQAPRGQAVCADGTRPRCGTRAGRAQRGDDALLTGRERPIVIARRRAGAPVAESVAPRSRDLGVMLPYTPLHHLLLADAGTTLVMTSGNASDEPIAYRDEDAARRLAGSPTCSSFTTGRSTCAPTTRSIRSVRRRPDHAAPLARLSAREHRPAVSVPRPMLAVGADLKSTFCVAKGQRRGSGHHIGDLENWETLRSFREGIEHFQRVFEVEPEVVAHDLHPDYLSTKEALDREASSSSACSITTHTSPPASPSTARRARQSVRSSTAPATAATARSGAASFSRGDLRDVRARGPAAPRAPAGRSGRDPRALADGLRLARGWPWARRSRALPGRLQRTVSA